MISRIARTVRTALVGRSLVAAAADITSNLEAYYRFDGNLVDSSGNSRSLTGLPSYGTGLISQCMSSGNASRTGYGVTNGNAFSVGYWVKYVGDPGGLAGASFTPAGFTDGLAVDSDNNGLYIYALFNGATSVSYTVSPVLDSWVQVLVTWDTTTARLYVNGSEVSSGAASAGAWFSNAMGFNAGIDAICPVDEGCVYSRALTANQVSYLYNGGSGRRPV